MEDSAGALKVLSIKEGKTEYEKPLESVLSVVCNTCLDVLALVPCEKLILDIEKESANPKPLYSLKLETLFCLYRTLNFHMHSSLLN